MKTNLLQKNIPKGWEIKKIKDLLDFEQPTKYIVESSSYTPDGKTAVLTANKSFVLGYTNETEGIYTDVPVIIFDDFTTDSKYVDFSFKIKSSAIKILKNRDNNTDLKFVYEIMKSFTFPIANHKRHYISQYQEIDIVIPSIKEQRKIAEILSAVDNEIQILDSLIVEDEKLKTALMQDLFFKGISHTKFKESSIGKLPLKWELLKLGEIASLSTGTTPSTAKKDYYDGDIPFIKTGEIVNNRLSKANVFISQEAVDKYGLRKYKPGTILLAMYGQGKTRGQTSLLEIEACTTQNAAAIVPSDKVLPEFLWMFLLNQYINLRDGGVHGHISHLSLSFMKGIQIPLPSKDEQSKITKILISVENKILMNKQLKDRLLNLKKGLMSDLLSGKVRTINNK